ncbi:DUF3099 domain-containing protein [Kineococcus gypseus]|uniref:DUF3099 domain-containing protein n=1 Tax=Kineococcus gypseus TaxID=1637102 RepID=UPI003D7E4748
MPAHPTPSEGRTARPEPPGVYRITSAPTALTDDLGVRYRKYVVSMLVRTACFLLFVLVDHWTRWLFVVGAIVLPYVAVVLANAGRESKGPPPSSLTVPEVPVRELPALEARITTVHSPGEGTGAGTGEGTSSRPGGTGAPGTPRPGTTGAHRADTPGEQGRWTGRAS